MTILKKGSESLKLYLKGVAMGIADLLPGISGGTIALMLGIYERLITSISSIDTSLFKTLSKYGVKAVYEKVDGTFVLLLMSGILTSVFMLSNALLYMVGEYGIYVWAFFFGMVLMTSHFLYKKVACWTSLNIALLVFGLCLTLVVGTLPEASVQPTLYHYFFSGMIAICAMILPGISGSVLLLLMGMYIHVVTAIKSVDVMALGVFASGCAIGLISFSKLLKWMYEKHASTLMSILTGVVLGSACNIFPLAEVKSGLAPLSMGVFVLLLLAGGAVVRVLDSRT